MAFQVVVWVVYGAIGYAFWYFAVEPEKRLGMLRWEIVRLTGGILLTTLIAHVVVRLLERGVRPRLLAGFALGSSVLLAGPWLLLILGVGWALGRGRGMPARAVGPWMTENGVVLLAWTAGFLAILFWRRSLALERESFAMRDLAQQAKLEALTYQLHPHFLFNSLNSLRALIDDDNPRAREMVTRLAEFLRYAVRSRPGEFVELGREVEALERYLDIERQRFDEQLAFELYVEPAASQVRVPELLLLPLIENAVTHGLAETSGRIEVFLEARRRGERLDLRISNSGTLGAVSSNGAGVGLDNVRRRLELHYPDDHELSIRQEGGRVTACLDLPVEAS